MGLQELIEEFMDDANGDIEYLTLAVYERIINDDELLQEIIIPTLKHEIRNRLRNYARLAEEDSHLSLSPSINPSADRLAFLRETFYVPRVGLVSWAEATVEHHEARIEFLNKKMNGLVDTITRHDKAIQEIKKAGAKNLGEIHGKSRRNRRASA